MKAEKKPNFDMDRTKLYDVIPLPAPYTIVVEITRLCNFKCYYCIHSTKSDPHGAYQQSRLNQDFMDKTLYQKIVQDIMALPVLPKRILIQGLGEPLMYPDFPDLVRQLRTAGFDGKIDFTTNGSLLTHEITDGLIDSGVSRINISLQGLTKEEYRKVCSYPLDEDIFMEQLEYLYSHRKDTHVYIKIIDAMLKTPEAEQKFYSQFGSLCDSIYVEHLVVNQIQMGDMEGKIAEKDKNIFQLPVLPRSVCPFMFYQMQIFLDGTVLACSVSDVPPEELAIGNVSESSLTEIWNGEKRRNVLQKMLKSKRNGFKTCAECQMVHCISDEKESLDDYAEELYGRLEDGYGFRD